MSVAHRARQLLARLLLAAGVIALGYVAYVVIDAEAYQANARQELETGRPQTQASPVAARQAGLAIGEIRIRRIGLRAIVAEGDSSAVLQRAVGHLADTAWPGESGNVVLAGHRDTYFRLLKWVRAGDAITLRTREGTFEYLVESTAVVRPTDLQVLAPTHRRTLTLITCFPFSYIGPAPKRFIVRAQQRSDDR